MFTLIISCGSLWATCGLSRQIVIPNYPTEEICMWSGEMITQYIPNHDNLRIHCAK